MFKIQLNTVEMSGNAVKTLNLCGLFFYWMPHKHQKSKSVPVFDCLI